eukprot:TRINITY_DN7444_c0_g1_i3.p4 TRINITY_DN7444_c0_g1~~TRINITY_DN7444_c0_g1_i3.p4  ORF type:complete len:137 (-),score=6.13 TRINITY_DN7444_c0_g1_i3:191-601(-)
MPYKTYINKNPKALNKYPIIIIPTDTIPTNIPNNFLLTTLLSIIIDGSDSAVTAIINESTVPIPTPFPNKASAIGSVPNISAYIGIPTTVAIKTENRLFPPITFLIIDSGIQLCIAAPTPTPINTYNHTFSIICIT